MTSCTLQEVAGCSENLLIKSEVPSTGVTLYNFFFSINRRFHCLNILESGVNGLKIVGEHQKCYN